MVPTTRTRVTARRQPRNRRRTQSSACCSRCLHGKLCGERGRDIIVVILLLLPAAGTAASFVYDIEWLQVSSIILFVVLFMALPIRIRSRSRTRGGRRGKCSGCCFGGRPRSSVDPRGAPGEVPSYGEVIRRDLERGVGPLPGYPTGMSPPPPYDAMMTEEPPSYEEWLRMEEDNRRREDSGDGRTRVETVSGRIS